MDITLWQLGSHLIGEQTAKTHPFIMLTNPNGVNLPTPSTRRDTATATAKDADAYIDAATAPEIDTKTATDTCVSFFMALPEDAALSCHYKLVSARNGFQFCLQLSSSRSVFGFGSLSSSLD